MNFEKVTPGQTLNFAKDFGTSISGVLSFNLNWGQINGAAVDLDAILVTKSSGKPVEAVKKAGFMSKLFGGKDEVSTQAGIDKTYYFGNKTGAGVKHQGDDRTGAEDKGEYIEVDLSKLPPHVDELVFSVISFSNHNFSDLPFASIEVFTGSPGKPGRGLVSMELTEFKRSTKAVVLAKVKRNTAGEWEVTGLNVEGTEGSVRSANLLSAGV